MGESFSEELIIKKVTKASIGELKSLYKEAGWWQESYEKDADFLKYIPEKSACFIGAFVDKKLIGMGRALSDRVSDAYIQDVTVLKSHRGKGIGKKIITALVANLQNDGVDWIGLVAQPGTTPFYEPLGFEPLKDHVALRYKER